MLIFNNSIKKIVTTDLINIFFGKKVNLFKKHSRMIKNRESACLSRKRKKEYIQNLEESLKQIKEQNNTMNLENQELKEKNLVLETEVTISKNFL